MTPRSHPDARIAATAARHHGIVTLAQALSCGLTKKTVSARVADGRWERLGWGVYRLTAAATSPHQRLYASLLATSDQAVAAASSALALFSVGSFPAEPQIIVPPFASARARGARVRRSPVSAGDRTVVGVIPSTSAARALLDVAPLVDEAMLDSYVDDVLDRRLATPSSVLGVIRRAPVGHGRWGVDRLRAALDPWLDGVRPGSPAEVRLLRRIEGWGLPRPVKQHRVGLPGGRSAFLDLAWPEWQAGLEYDGSRHHGPRQLADDVAREELVRGLGWWVGRADRHDLAPSSTRLRDELRPRLMLTAA